MTSVEGGCSPQVMAVSFAENAKVTNDHCLKWRVVFLILDRRRRSLFHDFLFSHQHFSATASALIGANDSFLFQRIDQSGCSRVANAQTALQQAGAGSTSFLHDRDRIIEQGVAVCIHRGLIEHVIPRRTLRSRTGGGGVKDGAEG